MSEPIKAKNKRTGEIELLYRQPDGKLGRTPPKAAPTGTEHTYDQPAPPTSGVLEQMSDDLGNMAQSFMRNDLADKVMAPLGSGVAKALNPDLPVNQPGSRSPQIDEAMPSRPLSPSDPLAALSTKAGAEMQQDMRQMEAETPRGSTVADVAQAALPSIAIPGMTAATTGGRMTVGALEGGLQGGAGALGQAEAGQETGADALKGVALGVGFGGLIPGMLGGLKGMGQALYNKVRGPSGGAEGALIDKALAAGAEPSFLGRAGLKASPRMEQDALGARAIQPGASGADKAYDDLADMVLPKVATNLESTLNKSKTAVDGAVALFPHTRLSTEPLRNQVNALLVKEVADITPEASIAGASKAAKIQGVEPYGDLASLGAESDMPLGSAASLRSFAQKLTRRLPPKESAVLGHAPRGSGAERELAGISDMTDDVSALPDEPSHRLAEYTVPELVELKRELDQHGRAASKLGQDDLVRSWRQLADTVRGMLPPEVAKVSEAEHQALNALEERLTQLGLPSGTRQIGQGRTEHWNAIRNKLAQDPLALRRALRELGPEVVPEANHAAGTLATEQLQGGTSNEMSKLLGDAAWRSPTGMIAGALGRANPMLRGASMRRLPNDVSPAVRRMAIPGMLPTLRNQPEEPQP